MSYTRSYLEFSIVRSFSVGFTIDAFGSKKARKTLAKIKGDVNEKI